MKLTVNGEISEYYVQMLCLLYFPCEKFSKTAEITAPDVPEAEVSVSDDVEGVYARVTLSYKGKTETAEWREQFSEDHTIEKTRKIACGKAFFEAGKLMFKITPAWGIMTGVRPAKLAFSYFDQGLTPAKVRKSFVSEYLVHPKKAALVTEIAQNEMKLLKDFDRRSCSLYISLPFCPSRCDYCSFVSYSSKKLLGLIDDYVVRICEDVRYNLNLIKNLGLKLLTVYIGGGTPTTLNVAQLDRLLDCICENTDVSLLEEFTLEAGRPDTVTAEKLASAKRHGVTRVCINTQTLNDEVLYDIGRRHTAKDYFNAFEIARNSGIKTINTDLIAGLPGEGFQSFSQSIDALIALRPENLTFHTLALKNASEFSQNKTAVSKKVYSDTAKSVDYSQLNAKNSGYIPYYIYRQKNTVSNLENVGFSLPGYEGRYNIYMMEELHSIFSAGAGAVTKMVSEDRKTIRRIFEYKYPFEFLSNKNADYYAEREKTIVDFYDFQFSAKRD